MRIKNTSSTYGSIAQGLHWLMALLLIGLLVVGLYMVRIPLTVLKLKLYGWHKEFGILALMLVIFRLCWRYSNLVPRLPDHMPWWEKCAAKSMHYLFYILMFALPLSGWLLSSASDLPVSFFGWFVLPDLIGPSEKWRFILIEVHKWLGYTLIAALLGHVAAALQHHFFYKDDILRRMLP